MITEDRLLSLAEAVCDRRPIDLTSYLEDSPAAELPALSLLAALVGQVWTVEPEDEVAPLTRWGRFELLSQLGCGAFGEVYRAWDPHFEREVAVKLRHSGLIESAGTRDALLAEGRLLAKIDHVGVARVYELGEHDGRFGLVMERVEGETLAAAVARRGSFPASEVAAFGVELACALAALHDAKVVHRDLKAQNVLVRPDDRLVLVDFGIGCDLSKPSDEDLVVSGTPLYMAPELFEGARPSPASDLYSLGVLLFHLLTGEFPIEAETVADLRAAHARASPLAVRRLGRRGHGLGRVVGTCLALRPQERPASARQVAKRLALWTRHGVRAKAWRGAGMLALLFGGAALQQPMELWVATLGESQAAIAPGRPGDVEGVCREVGEKAGGERSKGNFKEAFERSEPLRFCRDPYTQGNFLATRRRYREAERAFSQVDSTHPYFPTAQRQRVHHLVNVGRQAEGIDLLTLLLQNSGEATDAENLAMYLGRSQRFEAALDLVSQSRRSGLEGDVSLLDWPEGVALLGLGRVREAREHFRRTAGGHGERTVRQGAEYYLAMTEALDADTEEARRLLEGSLSADRSPYFRLREVLFTARLALERGGDEGRREMRLRLTEIAQLANLPSSLPELRTALRLADLAHETKLFDEIAAKLEAIDRQWPSDLSQVARHQAKALRASRAGEQDQARQLLEAAQAAWWLDLELLLTRRQVADHQGDRPAACRAMKTLVTERKGEFLWTGIAYEWKLLAARYEQDCGLAGSRTRRER